MNRRTFALGLLATPFVASPAFGKGELTIGGATRTYEAQGEDDSVSLVLTAYACTSHEAARRKYAAEASRDRTPLRRLLFTYHEEVPTELEVDQGEVWQVLGHTYITKEFNLVETLAGRDTVVFSTSLMWVGDADAPLALDVFESYRVWVDQYTTPDPFTSVRDLLATFPETWAGLPELTFDPAEDTLFN